MVSGTRVAAVGPWREVSSRQGDRVLDLGEVALLPGLINAHCHLDYTNMAGQFPPPKVFTDWLKLITTVKAGWSLSDYTESWLNGAQMLLSTGTTTVGDIESVPELLPGVWEATPLRVISFIEMIGITGRRKPRDILREAVDRINHLKTSRCFAGLSPHAPYSTLPELLRLTAKTAQQHNWRVAIHVAESALEFEMFVRGAGEMFDWLQRSTRDMSDCGKRSPIQHLEYCGLLAENVIAVHVNYLEKREAALLRKRQVSVVHCPRSHFYFRHDPFPQKQLNEAGVNICLGTDSLASVYKTRREMVELNMFEEMRALAQADSSLSARELLEMATVKGACALGMGRRIGELSKKAFADLIAIPVSGKTSAVYEAILQHQGKVVASMIDGRWAMPPTVN